MQAFVWPKGKFLMAFTIKEKRARAPARTGRGGPGLGALRGHSRCVLGSICPSHQLLGSGGKMPRRPAPGVHDRFMIPCYTRCKQTMRRQKRATFRRRTTRAGRGDAHSRKRPANQKSTLRSSPKRQDRKAAYQGRKDQPTKRKDGKPCPTQRHGPKTRVARRIGGA